jgi:hypothetical protein
MACLVKLSKLKKLHVSASSALNGMHCVHVYYRDSLKFMNARFWLQRRCSVFNFLRKKANCFHSLLLPRPLLLWGFRRRRRWFFFLLLSAEKATNFRHDIRILVNVSLISIGQSQIESSPVVKFT